MIKLRRNIIFNALLLGCAFLLSGCKMAVLDPKGMVAADEKTLLITATLLMLIVVVPVILLTIIFAWRYRESNAKATYRPDWSHNVLLEIIWWTIPCVIIVILAIITWISTHILTPYRQLSTAKPLVIQAVALNWKWLFIYPEQNIATVNYVQIPINQPIQFLITADAPMNSFQIPRLGGQIYAMAGMQTQLHLIANYFGIFAGYSANFSGEGFATMSFKVNVTDANDFAKWVNTVQQSPNVLSAEAYKKLVLPSKANPVTYYASVEQGLFHQIIMKYMMPKKEPIS